MKKFKEITIQYILKKDYLFVLLFTVMSCFYYDSILDKGPLNAHVWRQTDCLSMTHYYSKGSSFFKPEMHAQLSDQYTTGLTAGEFPILYYIMGNVWKLSGESYFLYRVFCLLILFAGLFAFYKALKIFFDDTLLALFFSLLLFTSPTLVIYGANFLTDVPAFSLILVALYFLLLYKQNANRKLFFISMCFFALAGLIKVSSLMAFLFLFFILVLETMSFKSLGKKKFFYADVYEWIGFLSVILMVFSWYCYAHFYNLAHGFKFTPNDIYPLWILNKNEVGVLMDDVQNFASYVFYSRPVLLVLFLAGVANLFLWKKIPPFAYWGNIIILLGSIAYFILWAPLLGIHDYYYVALLVLFLSTLMPFMWFLKNNYPKFFHGYMLKTVVAIFLSYNFLYCKAVVELKTLSEKGKFAIVNNDKFVSRMQWNNWDVRINGNRFVEMKPYLEQIGVQKEDKIISVPDSSPNASLYLSGHKGWTNLANFTKIDIELLIQKGAKYILVSNPTELKEVYLQPYLYNKIGDYKGVEVYKL